MAVAPVTEAQSLKKYVLKRYLECAYFPVKRLVWAKMVENFVSIW